MDYPDFKESSGLQLVVSQLEFIRFRSLDPPLRETWIHLLEHYPQWRSVLALRVFPPERIPESRSVMVELLRQELQLSVSVSGPRVSSRHTGYEFIIVVN
jgi:hypothetical protein